MAKGGWNLVGLATELGFIIAIPLVVLVVGGHWLDVRANTKVIFTIIGVLVALAISSYAIYLKIKNINH